MDMIPPTINELKQHTEDLANSANNLPDLTGTGKALVNVAVAVVALIVVTTFILPLVIA
jgi:hypothetical protein